MPAATEPSRSQAARRLALVGRWLRRAMWLVLALLLAAVVGTALTLAFALPRLDAL